MQLTASQEKCLDISSSFFVTANAGSGKTRVLIERIVKVLTESDTPIQNIVAITYTRKAAAEMQTRLRSRLYDLLQSTAPQEAKTRVRTAILDFHKHRISTIHSFCRALLNAYPAEAQVPVDFSDVSSVDEAVMVEQATMHVLTQEVQENSAALFEALQYYDLKEIISHTNALLTRHEEVFGRVLELSKSAPCVRAQHYLNRVVKTFLLPVLDRILPGARAVCDDSKNKGKIIDELRSTIRWAEELYRSYSEELEVSSALTPEVLTGLQAFCKALTTSKNTIKARPKVIAENIPLLHTEQVRGFREACLLLNENALQAQNDELKHLDYIVYLASLMRERVARRKQSLGALTFHDLQERCVSLLSQPEIRSRVRENIHALFVDEVQDINYIQYQILHALASGQGDEPAPTCFFVGDPKQSIYGFRHADVRLFSRLHRELKETRTDAELIQEITLQETFRLPVEIGTFVNAVSSAEFADAPSEWDVSYEAFDCRKEQPGMVEFLITKTFKDDESELAESQVVANHIRDMWPKHMETQKTIAVLCRRKDPLRALAHNLEQIGISTKVSDGAGFYASPFVRDLHQLLELLADHNNSVALYSVLHSSLCRISDTELLHLMEFQHDEIWTLIDDQNNSVSEHVLDMLHKLRTCIQLSHGVPAHRALEICAEILQWQAMPLQQSEFESRLSEYHKLLEIAFEAGARYQGSVSQFCSLLRDRIHAKEQVTTEEVLSDNCVQLMTIHGSKGLEFDTVIMLESQGSNTSTDALLVDPVLGLSCKSAVGSVENDEKSSSLLHFLLKQNERARSIAEDKRLNYVATTRAEHHLIVSGAIKNDVEPNKYLGWIGRTNRASDTIFSNPQQVFEFAGLTSTCNVHVCTAADVDNVIVSEVSNTAVPAVRRNIQRISEHITQVGQSFSASQLMTFARNPELWLAEYVIGREFAQHLEPTQQLTDVSHHTFFAGTTKGNLVHKALEELSAWFPVHHHATLDSETVRNDLGIVLQTTADVALTESLLSQATEYVLQLVQQHVDFFLDVALQAKTEVPFLLPFGQDFITGSFDALVPFGNEKRLYDWKTNSLAPYQNIDALGEHYRLQLELYLVALADLYPEQPSWTAGVVSTEILARSSSVQEALFEITLDSAELTAIRTKIQQYVLHMKSYLYEARHSVSM